MRILSQSAAIVVLIIFDLLSLIISGEHDDNAESESLKLIFSEFERSVGFNRSLSLTQSLSPPEEPAGIAVTSMAGPLINELGVNIGVDEIEGGEPDIGVSD